MKIVSLPAKADHFLPHAFPMVFIDRLLEADGERGLCDLQLTSAHIFVDSQGRMDRTCYVELAAQSFAAVEGWKLVCQGARFSSGFLVGVQAFECLDDARIGDLLQIETIELGGFDGYTVVRATINRGEETIAQGKIKLYVPASETPDPGADA
jgi:predicted hotdog family 3-hydroxylacyl-ACP dehydratase